jgi:hypothetical protein
MGRLEFQSLIGIQSSCKPSLIHFAACRLGQEGVSLQEQHRKFQSLIGIRAIQITESDAITCPK